MNQTIEEVFDLNYQRVKSLMTLHDNVNDMGVLFQPTKSEVLRGAVVLLHSTLEEFLRGLVISCFPYSSKKI